jgi:hypothetical protein
MAGAASLLASHFTLIATNVPYLVRGKQSTRLQDFIAQHYPESKNDLAVCMIERSLAMARSIAVVSPINWQHQAYYKAFRRSLLTTRRIDFVANLGAGAFETISGEVVNVSCSCISADAPAPTHRVPGFDVVDQKSPEAKATRLKQVKVRVVEQSLQLHNPDSRLLWETVGEGPPSLSRFSESAEGLSTGDCGRFVRQYWELGALSPAWEPLATGPSEATLYGGISRVLRWEEGRGPLARSRAARIQGQLGWGASGVLVSEMNNLRACLHLGYKHDKTCGVIIPEQESDIAAVWEFCSSSEYRDRVRSMDSSLKVAPNSLVNVPIDLEKWREIALENHPNGLPEPCSEWPTEWFFRGTISSSRSPLQVAVSRLLGYAWPEQSEDELDGLIASDGIVCLPAIGGVPSAGRRLHSLLVRAYGGSWSSQVLERLLEEAGCTGWSLERWLADRFFEQHCRLFGHRPFIWHIWDGLQDGFSALVHYQKLDRARLQTLRSTFLAEWIGQQKGRGGGSARRLAAAKALDGRLKLIEQGEAPHDIFVRWKSLSEQPLGWEPDLDDGVRLNIRPFMRVPDVGRKGAGVLRVRPRIRWGQDRGRDPSDAPWYQLGLEYGGRAGDRINDHHLSLSEKLAARTPARASLSRVKRSGLELGQELPA